MKFTVKTKQADKYLLIIRAEIDIINNLILGFILKTIKFSPSS